MFVVGFISGPIGEGLLGDSGLPFGLEGKPKPSLPSETVFHLFGFPIANSVLAAWITIIVLVGFSYMSTRRMKIIPGKLQGVFEFMLSSLYNFCQSIAGEKNGRRFFPIVATIFLFVALNAWLSLLPGFGSIEIINPEGHHVHLLKGANTDINMPLTLAFFSFISVWYFGFKERGLRYLGKFFNVGPLFRSIGPLFRSTSRVFKGKVRAGLGSLFNDVINVFIGIINIIVGFLELLSEFIRIVSFTFRLFGNMTAGEILLLIATFLIPWLFAIPFYGLELLVGFLQALIFGGLTLIFLTMAVAHHGKETTG
ncbi:F0F1 ATP synthase subunit A [Chloroflexota bacterium]